ncbi:replication protein C [Phenylobacterium sp. Root77]|jgi:replication initiation protein RepC|uniref:plasmid replication protein RepC n=1 Tax=unclassified Phenylobacterium TaxID=2640670 RepID=UPI0007010406|nr:MULTISPECIES: plasmid replication protein RepC [unclassified Phenylobacterium]KQW67057.1 replication protein C [Phenylobacterium sp. Root1277]KQW89750.1 replication protein C [Phenylobacterium sp. Root1290]KRC43561.1 replication protein C [Phenylobacterium sp. Root77]
MQTVHDGTGDVRRLADAQWAAARLAQSYEGLPEGVSKAMLLDRFERAAPRLGIRDGLVRLVRALVRVTQEQDWTGGVHRPIAWPSNDMLGEELQRSRTVIQGLIRAAVKAGLVHMRDSGNGKRYGYRGERGEVVEAFGFDLSPLAVRWDEFADLAAARGIENAERRRLRRKVGEIRREIRTVCADALEQGFKGHDWEGSISKAAGRLPRSPSLAELMALESEFGALLAAVDRAWMEGRRLNESEPTGSENRAHKEPTTDPKAETATYPAWRDAVVAGRPSQDDEGLDPPFKPNEEVVPLSLVLEAVPEIHAHLEDPGSADWEEFVEAAYKAALLLGINLSAWREARETMGRNRASIAVATVLARWRSGEVKSAGGYLRAMCERERTGDLHLLPSLYGLKERHHPRRPRERRST